MFKASSMACAKVLRHKAEEIRIMGTWDKLMDNIYRASWKRKGKNQSTRGSWERTLTWGAHAWYLCLLC